MQLVLFLKHLFNQKLVMLTIRVNLCWYFALAILSNNFGNNGATIEQLVPTDSWKISDQSDHGSTPGGGAPALLSRVEIVPHKLSKSLP